MMPKISEYPTTIDRLTDKATSTTLLGGVALAAMLVDAGQYWPAVAVYVAYAIKEAVRHFGEGR